MTLVQRGDWTREQALIALVYVLADAFSRMFQAEVERVMRQPAQPVTIARDLTDPTL